MPGTMKSCNSWPFRRCQRTEKLVAFFGQKMGCHLGISTSRVTIHVENESCSGSTQWMKVCRIDDFAQWIFHGRFVEGVGAGFLSTNLSPPSRWKSFRGGPFGCFNEDSENIRMNIPEDPEGVMLSKETTKPRIWRSRGFEGMHMILERNPTKPEMWLAACSDRTADNVGLLQVFRALLEAFLQ